MLSSNGQLRTNAFSIHRMTEPLPSLGKTVKLEPLVKPADMLNGLLEHMDTSLPCAVSPPGVTTTPSPLPGSLSNEEAMDTCSGDEGAESSTTKQGRTTPRNGHDETDEDMPPTCSSDASHLEAPPASTTAVKAEPINCGECLKQFTDIRSYMDHVCSQNVPVDENDDLLSDGESFDGKIIYNRDGSAYIIEGQSDSSDAESLLDVSQLEGSIIDERGKIPTSQLASIPQIANAVYIHRNPAMFYNSLYMLSEKVPQHVAPIMHSYRVYDVRTKSRDESTCVNGNSSEGEGCDSDHNSAMSKLPHDNDDTAAVTVPTKPILMCFICKLSFGFAKSFVAHAISEHTMELNSAEKKIIAKKNASAIIQGGGKDKLPLMSFLEPTTTSLPSSHSENTVTTGALATAKQGQTTASSHDSHSVGEVVTSYPSSSPSSSSLSVSPATSSHVTTPATKPAMFEPSDDSHSSCDSTQMTKCSSNDKESLCHKRVSLDGSTLSDDEDVKEKENLTTSSSPGGDDRPASNSNGVESANPARTTPDADVASFHQAALASQSSCSGGAVTSMPLLFSSSSANSMPVRGIVIRAGCEDHPQGNITGIGCTKCDMIVGGSRGFLGNGGSPVALMHSRNSCKTLKCPKCNWHYKYQETLEIHMKEKHLESDTQCIYCITNQAHPRLARGEVYNCGYKPYRCDVCNYSTTTKGNLSIHMQSDKHINNMQELQQTQQQQQQQQPPADAVIAPPPLPAPSISELPPSSGAITPPAAPDLNSAKKNKSKPVWRCDVCSYETNVARNLRIHMTSEKHTHNMVALQQSVNYMQRDMHIQLKQQMAYMGHDPNMMMLLPGGALSMPPFMTLDQAMLMSPLGGTPTSGGSLLESPVDLTKQENGMIVGKHDALLHPMDLKNNNEPTQLFQCDICSAFSSNSVEALHQHIMADRSKDPAGGDGVTVVGGTYMCNLCHYKTNLKANFQLHCKTDKHLQRQQLVNHIREGGPTSQWRLKEISTHASLPVQVRCHACDYLTNDTHKLQLHAATPQHDAAAKLFGHLLANEAKLYGGRDRYYRCTLCDYMARTKLTLIRHTRSAEHIRAENERIQQLREAGKLTDTDSLTLVNDIFVVNKCANVDDIKFDDDGAVNDHEVNRDVNSTSLTPDVTLGTQRLDDPGMTIKKEPAATSTSSDVMCPFCNFTDASAACVETHVNSQHASEGACTLVCPLCQEKFHQRPTLESHLVQKHNVTQEGMQRLMLIVDQTPASMATVSKTVPSSLGTGNAGDMSDMEKQESVENEVLKLAEEASKDGVVLSDKDGVLPGGEEQYRCQKCNKTFVNLDALCTHQNEQGHLELKDTPRGPGYLCWKKGCNQYFKSAHTLQVHFSEIHAKRQLVAVSERHIYKFRCNQCSLAFKTLEKLQLHSYYHIIRAATKCNVCGRNFRSVAAMQKHIESTHLDTMSATEAEKFRASVAASTATQQSYMETNPTEDLPVMAEVKTEDEAAESSTETTKAADGGNAAMTDATTDATMTDVSVKKEEAAVSGNDYKDQHFIEDYINSQAIAENSYADPTRKYKCHRCKVAFTKQTYLSAHNKTLMHRRGDKLSYPMEKYLDPNRPFKCDVCKESFTQKNILLVHYNSVSHLHKLKQQQGQSTSPSLPDQAPVSPKAATTVTATVTLRLPSPSDPTSPPQMSPVISQAMGDSPSVKPYKCNICKVSYSQSSTLDIHMRSVLHQTRASKLLDLASSGQLDLSQPLIEQPDSDQKEQRHKKVLQEMLQQRHPTNTTATAVMPSAGAELSHPASWASLLNLPSGSSSAASSELASKVVSTSKSLAQSAPVISHTLLQSPIMSVPFSPLVSPVLPSAQQPAFMCPKCSSIFGSQETLQQHQKMYCYMSQAASGSGGSSSLHGMPRFKPHVQRSLLQNIGFECVMQFNEYVQKKWPKKKDEVKEEAKEASAYRESEKENDQNAENNSLLPELNKCPCTMCGKEFSSIWVLKAHQEEVHQDIVPIKYVEQFSDTFREQYEKKQVAQAAAVTKVAAAVTAAETANEVAKATAAQQAAEKTQKAVTSSLAASLASMAQTSSMMPMPMFNMMPMGMSLSMNMAPPLMPIMMSLGSELFGLPGMEMIDPMFLASQQQQQQQQQAAAATALSMAQQNKRARTRINDEQLKILRAHFDINNSPSEEQILGMAEKTGLPPKVIKHWFRNTLFKERQRNKDSPYNFNVPPATTLNLEEYEKTCKVPADGTKYLPLVALPGREMKERSVDMQEDEAGMSGAESVVSSAPSTPAPCTPMSAAGEGTSAFTSVVPSASLSSSQIISSSAMPLTPGSNSSTSSQMLGKRANRTRFTDYQIKVLQDYFDHNAYPKDDDIEHLSRLLGLGPRVIVVWFQNMRQKARKTYENQPLLDTSNDGTRYSRTPGLNYQCKKCQTVFQRYYELIKHQKMYCFKDEDRDDDINMSEKSPTSFKSDCSMDSTPSNSDKRLTATTSPKLDYKCEQCGLAFDHFEQWRKHQSVHSMNQNLFEVFPPDSAFAMLQTVAKQQQQRAAQEQEMKEEVGSLSFSSKHKLEEDSDELEDDQPKDKRLRTTILPEQLDYLYLKYQLDCNPSRKQLESIAHEVGLKKRVVQVWFQNTRARERKGQYRVHQQLIHKRCPFCRALFRAKSAMESHLATKHPEEMAKGELNVDDIPDASFDITAATSSTPTGGGTSSSAVPSLSGLDMSKLLSNPYNMPSPFLPLMSPTMLGVPPGGSKPLEANMQKLYEDSLKTYLDELTTGQPQLSQETDRPQTTLSSEKTARSTEESPLDLSRPLKPGEHELTDDHNASSSRLNLDDSFSETHSESMENSAAGGESSPSSPGGSITSQQSTPQGSQPLTPNTLKRYRTHMTELQIGIMKNIFGEYKTPTMGECEILGKEIGLPKRVVQVWFQNARAKEKKAKLAYLKTFGKEMVVPEQRVPDECKLCHFQYTHKYTVQDHIFTKKHIALISKSIPVDTKTTTPVSFTTSPSTSQPIKQEADTPAKKWPQVEPPSAAAHTHLSQLHSMGLQAMSASAGKSSKSSETSSKTLSSSKMKTDDNKKDLSKALSGLPALPGVGPLNTASLSAAPMMNPFGGLPMMNPLDIGMAAAAQAGMFSFMYPGMGMMYPGMGMPMMPPTAMMPGPESMFMCDPMTFGTPLTLMQIPQEAIRDIECKLQEAGCTIARYTQDCMMLCDLKCRVSATDLACAHEAMVDVGYICKKCHMVYPARDACVNHQRMLCYQNEPNADPSKSILKLEQIQYECCACSVKFSSITDYKAHCELDTHKSKSLGYKPPGGASAAAAIKSEKSSRNVLETQKSNPGEKTSSESSV